jgi:nucleotide-binding universal stress UspA family protein
VEQVLAAVDESGADTLAVGYHRGGPAGIIEAGSTGRRLLHAAPGAVLTIPL